jgi:hypothetical protein
MLRGPNLWHLNTSHLKDTLYQEKMKTLWTQWQAEKYKYQDLGKWWDMGKNKIKTLSINHANLKRRNKTYTQNLLQKELEQITPLL